MIPPITTEAEYEAALARCEVIFNAEKGTPEFAELDELVDRVVAYEAIHYPMGEAKAKRKESVLA